MPPFVLKGDVMLEAIRLKDCQSLGDCVLSFTSRLNVIVAGNNTGKSVLYKVLKLAGRADYYTREERKDLIRRGAASAQVTFKFDDGTYALMQVRSDKAVYAFLESAKANIAWYLEPPDDMVSRLGLLVSNTEAFIANIVDMDQGLLLVNPRLRSNYELVKMIATCESLDELRDKIDSLLSEFREKSIRTADSISFVEKQLSQLEYYDVGRLEQKHRAASLARDWLFNSCTIFENISLVRRVGDGYCDFDNMLRVVDTLEVFKQVHALTRKCGLEKRYFPELELKALLAGEALLASVRKMKVRKQIDGGCEALLGVLETLMAVRAFSRKAGRPRDRFTDVAVADVSGWLESLLRAVKSFTLATEAAGRHQASAAVWEEKFIGSGKTVECPVWGEVIFDGKSCSVKEVSGG